MTRHQKRMLKQAIQQVGLHILFIVICFVTLIPILYALSVSLNADNSLVSSDFRFIPKNFTLRNYVAVFTEEPVMLWFKNSMTLAVVTVVISLAAAIPAAYAFSRMRFKGRKPILKQLVLLYSFPSVLSMFAIYTLLRPLGLINSKVGLILIYTGTMAEFALLNMKGYFDTIPREIEEAAEIDGCGRLKKIWYITLMCVDEHQNDTDIPIVFPEWSMVLGTKLKRRDFRLDVLLKANEKPTNKQKSLFDTDDDITRYLSKNPVTGEYMAEPICEYPPINYRRIWENG